MFGVVLQPLEKKELHKPSGESNVELVIAPNDLTAPLPAQFAIRIFRTEQRGPRVIVTGELDLDTAPQLQAALEQEMAEVDQLLLDLSRLEFIDSTGLQAILLAVRAAEVNGSNFSISSSLAPQARRLFSLVGLLDQLPLVDD